MNIQAWLFNENVGFLNLIQKSLEEKTGCLLKFSGDLDDQTCREDLHEVFSGHGEIKWIHFVRGAKEVSNLRQGLKLSVLKFENE